MAKRPDINLIPTELRQQRKIEEVRKSFNFAGLGVFLLLAVVSISVFGFQLKLRNDSDNDDKLISREQQKIKDLSGIEGDASRLKTKSDVLALIFKSQSHFSTLLDALAESTPQDVTVSNFSTAGENKISISGNAQSYTSLANFILSILNPNLGGRVFSGADLTSVSLDDITGRSKFALILYIKSGALVDRRL